MWGTWGAQRRRRGWAGGGSGKRARAAQTCRTAHTGHGRALPQYVVSLHPSFAPTLCPPARLPPPTAALLQLSRIRNTGVPAELLRSTGLAITALPEDFAFHRQIKKVYETRRAMIESGERHSGDGVCLCVWGGGVRYQARTQGNPGKLGGEERRLC